jgi:alpha-acetolactate decarboxylase
MVGIRSPPYLNPVLEIPYHIHFLTDDRKIVGHVTKVVAEDLEVEWARIKAVNIRYWDTD